MSDTFTFRRDYEGHTITVHAVHIPRGQYWGVMAKLDGECVEHTQTDDVWTAAQSIIADALLELQDENDEPDDVEGGEGTDGEGQEA